jgi:putative ABC transport system permease protein
LLTLGIGANTALFSVVHTVLLKPLPYPDPGRLVTVFEANSAKSQNVSLVAPGRLEDWNRLNHAFTAISGSYSENVTDTSGAEPERLTGLRVAPRYLVVYGVPALTGRTFDPNEEIEGGPSSAVISYGLWTRRFGRDPKADGRRLIIGGSGFSIVGVMPRDFSGLLTDVWIPAQASPRLMQTRDARFLSGIGRIRPGVTLEQARADIASVQHALGEQHPATDQGWSVVLQDLKSARVSTSAKPLLLLFGAVALLLVITVTNIASLVLAQLHSRERELAIRSSLGATRQQVVGSVMRELVLLALAGTAGGFAAAAWSVKLLPKLFSDTPRMTELQVDWRAFGFAVAAGLLGAAAFGLLPALRATSSRNSSGFVSGGRGTTWSRWKGQGALIVGQIALTMLLLSGAGLLLRSFYNLNHVELGFNPDGVALFHVGAAWDENRTNIGHLQEQLIADLKALPGVSSAGITNFLPASGATLRYQISLEGEEGTENTGRLPAGSRTVSPGYLQALQVPLLAGTWCPELHTDPKAPRKVMVNRRFVDVYAHGKNVVGRHVRFLDFSAQTGTEIVGVIGDMKEDALNLPAYPYVYGCAIGGGWPDPEYVVRTSSNPRAFLGSVRKLIAQVDATRAVFDTRTLDEELGASLDNPRSNVEILAFFALAALLLAATGLYGLVTEAVSARRREIGVRMALGADPALILRSVVGGACRLIATGLAGGLALTALAQPALRSVVYGVSPLDAVSVAVAGSSLAVVGIAAALLPAKTAARIDPVESMRAE